MTFFHDNSFDIILKTISRKSDVRKVGLHEISQFLAQLNMLYSTVQGIGKFRADLLFSHQTLVKWPLNHMTYTEMEQKISDFAEPT